ncbi:MBL fold metallo-hydrolase [candidate division KSB1 bacterium]
MSPIKRRTFIKSSAGAVLSAAFFDSTTTAKTSFKDNNNADKLKEVDHVTVTLIMDNYTDVIIPGNEVAHRRPQGSHPFDNPLPIAEHGFCALIETEKNGKKSNVLLDTGASPTGILYNMDVLGLNPQNIQTIAISHSHTDHTFGLAALLDKMDAKQVPVVLHPDACLDKKAAFPSGEVHLPTFRLSDSQQRKAEFIKQTEPTLLADNTMLMSGEIKRTTDFEKGFPFNHTLRDGTWEHDPLMMEDQCITVNVKNKGLVLITGCGHAGIINSVLHAKSITGIKDVYMILGGFHLTGKIFEPIIPDTVEGLKEINPRWVLPGHCSGWIAMHRIEQAMPEQFIQTCVCTKMVL